MVDAEGAGEAAVDVAEVGVKRVVRLLFAAHWRILDPRSKRWFHDGTDGLCLVAANEANRAGRNNA